MTLRHKMRRYLRIPAYALLALVLLLIISVAGRIIFHPSSVRAGNAVFYPKFCLGGWDHPQKASGDPELDSSSPASAYSINNSAFLASSVSAQIFCGYFSTEDKTNAPTEVTIAFNWNMGTITTVTPESVQTLVVPEIASTTIQQTVQYDNIGPSTITLTEVGTSTASTTTTTTTTTTVTPTVETTTTTATTTPSETPAQTPTPTPAPAPTPTPAEAPVTPAETTPVEQTSFVQKFLSFVTPVAHAQSGGQVFSNAPLFDVSYSVDGIRWNSVGTVGIDNWQGYTIQIPVKTWDELNRLQLSVSPLPSLDKRPDVYLESIAARVTYDRTLGESATDAVDAVTNVVDTITTTLINIPVINQIIPPQKVFITKKKLLFSIQTQPSGLSTDLSSDQSSLIVSGSCSDKYFVVLVYGDERDVVESPASFVGNEARECHGGTFSYDLSSLSTDIKTGTYYVVMGEEGDRGPWKAVTKPFPIDITASSTTEEITQ